VARLAGLAAIAAALISGSCALFGPEAAVRVVLPALPKHWAQAFPDLGCLIVFLDARGGVRKVEARDWGTPVVVSCSKAGNTPILAYPAAPGNEAAAGDGSGFLRPAGGLYPISLGESNGEATLSLMWQDGPVAYLFHRLAALGRDTSLVNAERLSRCLGVVSDPWALDLVGMAEKLATGAFTAHDIECLPGRDVQLTPGAGEWFLESPFSSVMLLAEGATLELHDVPLGMHPLLGRRPHDEDPCR